MKAMMMSIRPQYVANILNGDKTIEVRKRFPKDYVGWVYIYCTKEKKVPLVYNKILQRCTYESVGGVLMKDYYNELNGKVVGRFWCNKVDKFYSIRDNIDDFLKKSCLEEIELWEYLKSQSYGYAIHISKLEIFDEPKEINEFSVYSHSVVGTNIQAKKTLFKILKPLSRAPQSWCWVEV